MRLFRTAAALALLLSTMACGLGEVDNNPFEWVAKGNQVGLLRVTATGECFIVVYWHAITKAACPTRGEK